MNRDLEGWARTRAERSQARTEVFGDISLGYGPETWVTKYVRYMGESDAGWRVTGNRGLGDSTAGSWGTGFREMGDSGPVQETVDVQDMGDAGASSSSDALEDDLPHG